VCDADGRLGRAAAVFQVDEPEEVGVVAVAEVKRRSVATLSREELEAAVRKAVHARHQLHVHKVMLVRPGGIPKTTSGKVRRRECRRLFLEGQLPMIAEA
jgi:acyl-CoA synthetase (AMP-forming)/AMP-acid ligase II